MSILTMIIPFVLTGLVLTAAALAWANYKQRQGDADREIPGEADDSDHGGDL